MRAAAEEPQTARCTRLGRAVLHGHTALYGIHALDLDVWWMWSKPTTSSKVFHLGTEAPKTFCGGKQGSPMQHHVKAC